MSVAPRAGMDHRTRFKTALQRSLALALAFALFAPPVSHAQVEASAPEASAIEAKDFFRTLTDTFTILSNPEIDEDVKVATIDDVFRELDGRCQASCELPLQTLRKVNELAASPSVQDLIAKIKESPVKPAALPAEQLAAASKRVEAFLEKQDPARLRFRIGASIQLLRYVISLRERSLMAMVANPKASSEAREQMTADIQRLSKQLKAMYEIGTIIAAKSKSASQAKDDYDDLAPEAGVLDAFAASGKKFSFTPEEAKRVATAVSDLDMIIVSKIVQSISNNAILFGDGAMEFFKKFQDDLPKIPSDIVVKTITEELGKSPYELFVGFDPDQPIASATIGQTYKVKIKTAFGLKEVILKVQRPGLQEALSRNRALDHVLLDVFRIVGGSEETAPLFDLLSSQVTGMEDAIEHEMNLSFELEQLERARMLLAFQGGIRIPKPIRRLSSSRVLTMEVIPGQNIDSLLSANEPLTAKARARMYSRILDAYLYQAVVLGEIHGDMHPGNVLATRSGDIGLIDWAHVFQSRGMVSYPAKTLYYALSGNPEAFASEFAKMSQRSDFPVDTFTVKVKEIFEKHQVQRKKIGALITSTGGESLEAALKLIGESYQEATKLGFRVTPAYFQFVRTSLPVASVLASIGKGMPAKAQKSIAIRKLLFLVPGGAAKAIGGRTLELLSRPQREIARRLVEYNRQRALMRTEAKGQRVLTCHDLFAY